MSMTPDTPNAPSAQSRLASWRPFVKCLVGGPLITAALFLIPWAWGLVDDAALAVAHWFLGAVGVVVATIVSALVFNPAVSLFVLVAALLSATCVFHHASTQDGFPAWMWNGSVATMATSVVLLVILLVNSTPIFPPERWESMALQQPARGAAAQVDQLPVETLRSVVAATDDRGHRGCVDWMDTQSPEAIRGWDTWQKRNVCDEIHQLAVDSRRILSPVECRRLVAGYLASAPAVQSRYALDIEGQRVRPGTGANACRAWGFSTMEFSLAR